MIETANFYNELVGQGIEFFTGVPDSLLKDICGYIADKGDANNHVIAANEGGAVGLAVGHHLATGKVPLVYLQNSGLGNTVNPLLSIADDKVYGIPMLLLIGWRGEPDVKDEPQHVRQGEVNEDMLKSMTIPYTVVDKSSDFKSIIKEAVQSSRASSKPHALLVRKGTFATYKFAGEAQPDLSLNREDVVKLIIDSLGSDDIVVSTTGKTSREVFEYREEIDQGHEKDFLTVGAMGHTSSIAMGISLSKPDRKVYCLDGDGSVLMHMGSLPINGQADGVSNFKHIVINNGAHDSVGGQPTVAFDIDFVSIAKASGYTFTKRASEKDEIIELLKQVSEHEGRALLEIRVNKGARADLGRPTRSPLENKIAFMQFLDQ